MLGNLRASEYPKADRNSAKIVNENYLLQILHLPHRGYASAVCQCIVASCEHTEHADGNRRLGRSPANSWVNVADSHSALSGCFKKSLLVLTVAEVRSSSGVSCYGV